MASVKQLIAAAGMALIPSGAVGLSVHTLYFNSTQTYPGVVQPSGEFFLNFENRGPLAEIDVRVGDHVVKGQILAKQDQQVAQLQLTSARSSLAAAQTNLGMLQGGVSNTELAPLTLQVQLAQAQVANQQRAVADTASINTLTIQQAQQEIQATNAVLATDQQAYASQCPPAAPLSVEGCLALARQVTRDQQAVAEQNAAYQRIVAQTQLAADAAQRQLNVAQLNVQMAQASLAVKAQPASLAAQIASAQAEVARDQAEVALDQQALASLVLTAPVSGIVTGVSGNLGEQVGNRGVQNFGGPPPLVTSLPSFQLFAPPAQPATAQSMGPSPVVQMAADGAWVVVAQVLERDAGKLRQAERASVTFDAMPGVVSAATLQQVIPQPVQVSNKVEYNVLFELAGRPAGVLPGMTASVNVSG